MVWSFFSPNPARLLNGRNLNTMRFCENQARIIQLVSKLHPDWAPFWVNYKALKTLCCELPSVVIEEDCEEATGSRLEKDIQSSHGATIRSADSTGSLSESSKRKCQIHSISSRPSEVAFFKLLHSELHKTSIFYDNVCREMQIRSKRIESSLAILDQATNELGNRLSANAENTIASYKRLSSSILRFSSDLLLLETWAIFCFCSFSKILKKHDKVTGYSTRYAFIENKVKKARWFGYQEIYAFIQQCNERHDHVMNVLSSFEQKEMEEIEDEELRLFVHMIWKLNAKASITAEGEGAECHSYPKELLQRIRSDSGESKPSSFAKDGDDSSAVSSSAIAEISDIVNEYGSLVH